MNTNRRVATLVGIFFILGTAAGIGSVVVTQPLLGHPDFLSQIAAHESRMVLGALLVLMMGLALVPVPILLYPLFKRQNEVLALSYVVVRGALEMIGYFAMSICWLFLIALGKEYTTVGAAYKPVLQALGVVLLKGSDGVSQLLVIIFSLDALILYYLLYRTQLVPRWISIWGFISILLHLSYVFIKLFSVNASDSLDLLNVSILVQEMVMAGWMIAKGFNRAALARLAE